MDLGRSGTYKVSDEAMTNGGGGMKTAVEPEKKSDGGYVNEGFEGKQTPRPRPSVQLNVPPDNKDPGKPYRGMGKEELLYHSSKPLWRRLRYVCMCVVLLGWLALIITVVALILIYPRCRSHSTQEWWQTTTIYRVYLRSFQDSDGDEWGDINGVTSRLDYLKSLGVGAISLSPFYQLKAGSSDDFDIINHKSINQQLGTLDDFLRLLNETHQRDMKLLVDFIPNLTSDEHPWFLESSRSQSNAKRNYYVWAGSATPPNNWKSLQNGPAWTLAGNRSEWYLHQFQSDQPDLNLRSAEVKDELKSVLEFWLDKGVDGFYVRQSAFLFEDYDLRNESMASPPASNNSNDYGYYDHVHTYALSEVYDMLARWRAYLDEYGNQTQKYRLLFADVEASRMLSYYGMFNRDGVDFPLNQLCLQLGPGTDGLAVASVVHRSLDSLPSGRWANWMGGDESTSRMVSRLGANVTHVYLMLTMLLPGTPYFYYGDEIGMEDRGGLGEQRMLTLMQWDNSSHAGFCSSGGSCTPWIDPHPDAVKNNVAAQNASENSVLHLFRNLTSLRQEPSFEYGDYIMVTNDTQLFSFVREFDGQNGFLVALNFGSSQVSRQLQGLHETIPASAEVRLTSGSDVSVSPGDSLSLAPLELGGRQGVVVSWSYVAKEL